MGARAAAAASLSAAKRAVRLPSWHALLVIGVVLLALLSVLGYLLRKKEKFTARKSTLAYNNSNSSPQQRALNTGAT